MFRSSKHRIRQKFLIERGFHKEFCVYKHNHRALKRMHCNRARNIINTIFEEIHEALVEAEGGVTIKGFGYFHIIRSVKKVFSARKNEQGVFEHFVDTKKQGRLVRPHFIGYGKMSTWTMDAKFSNEIKDRVLKNVYAGKIYKAYPHTVKLLKLV